MGLPRKLKNCTVFIDGINYAGEVPEVTLPTLTRTMEDYRGGGMGGPVKIDMGQEAIEMEVKAGGLIRSMYRQFGATEHDAVLLRFVGAYQRDDTGSLTAGEVTVRGRWEEIDPGSAKAGDDTEQNGKLTCSYYRLVTNGETLVEIDMVNNVFISGGVDRTAAIRDILGG